MKIYHYFKSTKKRKLYLRKLFDYICIQTEVGNFSRNFAYVMESSQSNFYRTFYIAYIYVYYLNKTLNFICKQQTEKFQDNILLIIGSLFIQVFLFSNCFKFYLFFLFSQFLIRWTYNTYNGTSILKFRLLYMFFFFFLLDIRTTNVRTMYFFGCVHAIISGVVMFW